MKAAVYKGNRRLEVEEIETPRPGPGQVLIKTRYSAICGTDVHSFLYDIPPPGTVLGHEYCGVVAEVGPSVTRWQVGDRVIGGGGHAPPGVENASRANPRFNFRTATETPANPLRAYAEYVLLREWEPLPIPEGVSDEAASLCEPCSVAVHAARLSDLQIGDAVGVFGAGPIGLFCVQVTKANGANRVIVVEPSETRRSAALELGADAAIDPTTEDPIQRLVELTGGVGPHVIFECAGAPPTLDQALQAVARRGQVVLVAIAWESVSVLPSDWIGREVKLQASFASVPDDWAISLRLMQEGKVRVGPMLPESSFVPLEGIQQAFEDLVKPSRQLQMVVRPGP